MECDKKTAVGRFRAAVQQPLSCPLSPDNGRHDRSVALNMRPRSSTTHSGVFRDRSPALPTSLLVYRYQRATAAITAASCSKMLGENGTLLKLQKQRHRAFFAKPRRHTLWYVWASTLCPSIDPSCVSYPFAVRRARLATIRHTLLIESFVRRQVTNHL
uniref:Uncharacterized protein n=1 Tax=Plectus sambesii TaxID=2011161 RepID=A0A914VJU1_9BILA